MTSRSEKREDHQVEEMLESKCQRLTEIPVNIIAHGIDYVNKRIEEGQYFFTDIKKEGVMLWDAEQIALVQQRELTSAEKKKLIEADYKLWSNAAKEFLIDTVNAFERKSFNNSVFYLHQATERIYNIMILVFTGYKPKTHNIAKLMRMSRDYSPELAMIFPNDSKEEKHLFNLLKKAYIDARYNENYVITEGELNILIERINKLQTISEKVCRMKIESL